MFPAMPAAALSVYPCATRKSTIAAKFSGSIPPDPVQFGVPCPPAGAALDALGCGLAATAGLAGLAGALLETCAAGFFLAGAAGFFLAGAAGPWPLAVLARWEK